MSDAVTGLLRAMLALLGQLALAGPVMSGSLVTATVIAIAVALLVAALIAATVHSGRRGTAAHPTRRTELVAPLTQSDPDAAGHVRRRGPGQVTAAA